MRGDCGHCGDYREVSFVYYKVAHKDTSNKSSDGILFTSISSSKNVVNEIVMNCGELNKHQMPNAFVSVCQRRLCVCVCVCVVYCCWLNLPGAKVFKMSLNCCPWEDESVVTRRRSCSRRFYLPIMIGCSCSGLASLMAPQLAAITQVCVLLISHGWDAATRYQAQNGPWGKGN